MAAKRLAVLEARDNFAEILHRVAYGGARFIVHRYGKELAAIVPVEDLRKTEAAPIVSATKRDSSRRAESKRSKR